MEFIPIVTIDEDLQNEVLNEDSRPFPMLGISLAGINDFIERCGGRAALQQMSTKDVCNMKLLPTTSMTGSSYCDYIEHHPDLRYSNYVSTANIFISHAWNSTFLQVIDAIKTFLGSQEGQKEEDGDHYLWFDLFSNNQHFYSPLPFEWWQGTFMNAIQNIGRVVMVMDPWDNPLTLTRSWCLWEIYCAVKTNSDFEIAMSRDQKQAFETALMTEDRSSSAFLQMLSNVNVRKSVASKSEDKENIFKAIKENSHQQHDEEDGCNQLNILVIEKLKNWIVSTVLASLNLTQDTERLRDMVGCTDQLREQIIPFRVCTKLMRLLGRIEVSLKLAQLGVLYSTFLQPKHDECALEMILEAIKTKAVLGSGNNTRFSILPSLDIEEVEVLFLAKSFLSYCQENLPNEYHDITLETMTILAKSASALQAMPMMGSRISKMLLDNNLSCVNLFETVLTRRLQSVGNDHPLTAVAWYDYAHYLYISSISSSACGFLSHVAQQI